MAEIKTADDYREEKSDDKRSERRKLALKNNAAFIDEMSRSGRRHLVWLKTPKVRRVYADYLKAQDFDEKFELAAEIVNMYENSAIYRFHMWRECAKDDRRVLKQRGGKTKVIDRSDADAEDYYSVAVIVKNEARYMREFVLFYLATGADRIYVYDNDSTDNLTDVLKPFIESGKVIYIEWPGKVVQAAAYRDAVRRTKKRSKWLALIDADEFLFSPKGSMPEQLKPYEEYPGVCANWMLFGPNGHDRRPEGLVMDNYTTTVDDSDYFMHCHVKSIVQPARVRCTIHPHFSHYKGGEFAVNEEGKKVDNSMAYVMASGRAFTEQGCKDVFRINHYMTRSLQDLDEKIDKGYPDGSPKTIRENALVHFKEEQVEDLAVKPYADIVREQYDKGR